MSKNTRSKAQAVDCPWQKGELGRDEEFVRVATPSEMAEVDEAMGLQMISIRLEKGLLGWLKEIAAHHGIGYQPMIRDLLNRFARAEIKSILADRLEEAEREEKLQEEAASPVKEFIERRRA